MSGYESLAKKFADKEVVILDGAVGTQLQAMGVPMNTFAWAAEALHSHPFTVRRMHEDYIRAGCDVITVNTYASARHNLEPLGQADLTRELNLRAVMLADDARERAGKDRPVWIAGSVSNFGLAVGAEPYTDREFEKYFGYTKTTYLDTTYRFNNRIAEVSGRFIQKNPLQLKKNLN